MACVEIKYKTYERKVCFKTVHSLTAPGLQYLLCILSLPCFYEPGKLKTVQRASKQSSEVSGCPEIPALTCLVSVCPG